MVERPGQSRARLIVSGQAVNDADRPILLGLQILDRDPGGLLSIRLGEIGWASILTIEVVMRRRLGELLYVATDEEMDAVSIALRAAQDL